MSVYIGGHDQLAVLCKHAPISGQRRQQSSGQRRDCIKCYQVTATQWQRPARNGDKDTTVDINNTAGWPQASVPCVCV